MDLHWEVLKEDPRFWTCVSFALFFVVFSKYVWPIIAGGLDKRAATISAQLEQANRLRAEAESLLADAKRKQKDAENDAKELLKQTKKDAAALTKSAEEELKTAIERRTAQAEENIKRAETDAVAQIRTQLVDIATETARQVIVAQLKDQKDDPAVARALQSIARNIH